MAPINDPGGDILGIASAVGWVAIYRPNEAKRLACWALMKRKDGADTVIGLLAAHGGGFDSAEKDPDFTEYRYQP